MDPRQVSINLRSFFRSQSCRTLLLTFSLLLTSSLTLPSQAAPPVRPALQVAALIGDAGVRNRQTEILKKSLRSQGVQNLILLGDNLYNERDTYDYVWDSWKTMGFRFSVVAIGNHNKSYPEEMKYFRMRNEYYSLESQGVLYVVLNSDNEARAAEQGAWLDQLLTQAQNKMIFLIYHHPSVTLTKRHEWKEKIQFQSRIRPLLLKHKNKITAVLVGHDHAAAFVTLSGIPLILSGATHETRDITPLKYTDGAFLVQSHWVSGKDFYWVKMSVSPRTSEAWFQFFNTNENKLICTFHLKEKTWQKDPRCR